MNQKDYKAIAEINKEQIEIINNTRANATTKAYAISFIKAIIRNQANYFEKEDKELAKTKLAIMKENGSNEEMFEKHREFNRKQFLKDCGIEEV